MKNTQFNEDGEKNKYGKKREKTKLWELKLIFGKK